VKEAQTDPIIKALADEQLLTLIGLHLLQTHFMANKKVWTLVANKAKKILIAQLNCQATLDLL